MPTKHLTPRNQKTSRRAGNSRSKVTFRQHTRKLWTIPQRDQRPSTQRPATQTSSRFSSLFIALLSSSPAAIEFDAVDEVTLQAVQKSTPRSTAADGHEASSKRNTITVEKRATRWRRFKYELKLKFESGYKIGGDGKGATEYMELEDIASERRRPNRKAEKEVELVDIKEIAVAS